MPFPLNFASMVTGKKLTRIALLMIMSELLIAMLVARWLHAEFISEKTALQKNLHDQFMAARSRVMDSVISRNFIGPMLSEQAGKQVKVIHRNSDTTVTDSFKVIALNARIDTIWESPDAGNVSAGADRNRAGRDLAFEMNIDSFDHELYRGVKLFISKIAGPNGEAGYFNRHIESNDTTLIKKYFSENLQQQKLHVQTDWIKPQPGKQVHTNPFVFESMLFEVPFAASVKGYHSYLFSNLWPQILFALLLLVITSAAFLLAFRSLRNQLRLAEIKDDFISNISHELKTPLATMKVAVEAMQQMDPAGKKSLLKEYLSMTQQEITRLDSLTNIMMNSLLIETGQMSAPREWVDLQSVIRDVMQTYRLNPQNQPFSLKLSADRDADLIFGNPIQIHGIFYNLLDNSMKYGNENPAIEIQVSTDQDAVTVNFCDNGPGIPEAFLNKVFDKFFRVPTGDQHNVKGYGVGLHYVAQVMKILKGSVTVKNLPQGGCCFTLLFPNQA